MMKLKYKTDASVSKLRQVRASEAGHILAVVEDSTLRGQVEGAYEMQQGALSGAGRTDDRYHLAAPDFEIDTFENFE
jgi:hypothetical protein